MNEQLKMRLNGFALLMEQAIRIGQPGSDLPAALLEGLTVYIQKGIRD